MIISKKLIECPHCRETSLYKNWGEFENHKNNCPSRFKDPKRRFNERIKEHKTK